jgi:O-antigen/teichoic acid export membrane protein
MQANQVVTPILFRKFKEGNSADFIKDLTYTWFFISIVFASLVSLWIPILFPFLYRNPSLSESAPFAVILFFTFCYRPMYVAAVDFSIFNKRTLPILWITLISAGMNLIINLIFIPDFGAWASVWATLISYLALPILGFYGIRENAELRKKIKPLHLIFLTLSAAAIGYSLFSISLAPRIVITLILFSVVIGTYKLKFKDVIRKINHE